VTGGFEHAVEDPLHGFPNRVAARFDHHAPGNVRQLGQIAFSDNIEIPFRKVLLTRGDFAHVVVVIINFLNPGRLASEPIKTSAFAATESGNLPAAPEGVTPTIAFTRHVRERLCSQKKET
jgi:hypothetical protein